MAIPKPDRTAPPPALFQGLDLESRADRKEFLARVRKHFGSAPLDDLRKLSGLPWARFPGTTRALSDRWIRERRDGQHHSS